MAEIPYTVQNVDGNLRVVTWAGLANGDTGQPYRGAHFSDCGFHVYGTFGVGGNARLQGTAETAVVPAHWEPLVNPDYVVLNIGAASQLLDQILTRCYQMRPSITAGDGTTSLTVIITFTSVAQRWRAQE